MTKRCVHVVECFAGGTLEVVRQLANDQARRGWQVTILHGMRPDTPPPETLNAEFAMEVVRTSLPFASQIHPVKDMICLLRLVKWLKRHPQDVIHLHSSKAGLLGRLAARIAGMQAQVLFTPHSWSFLREDISTAQRRLFLLLEWLGARLGGTIMACGTEEARLSRDTLKANSVVLVRNGLRLPELSGPKIRRPDQPLTLISVGRLAPQKAPERFAFLAATLRDQPWRFVWVGDGDPQLRAQLEACGVHVTGFVPRAVVAQHLQHASLFVLLSAWEGLPLALIEAQSIGLPAVVSDIPGCHEVIDHGVNGFIACSNTEAVAHVQALLDNSALRLRMSEEARRLAQARFSAERFLEEAAAVYTSVAR